MKPGNKIEDSHSHTFVNGKCECGEEDSNYVPPSDSGNIEDGSIATPKALTIMFDDKNNRSVFSSSQQVWEQNGITVTNNKGNSTSDIADYSNPVYFYKNSQLIVECSGMVKIEFECNSDSYAFAFISSLSTDTTVSSNGSFVTVTFPNAVNNFQITSLSAGMVRMNSITVYVVE